MNDDVDDLSFDWWGCSPTEYWEHARPLLHRMCAALGIDREQCIGGPMPASMYADLFPGTKIFDISGAGFERPMLPCGSYLYCTYTPSNTDAPFAELSPRNAALNQLLAANWDTIHKMSPVRLADFVLTMQTVETVSHEVLTNLSDIENGERREEGFVLTDECRNLVNLSSLSTSMETTEGKLTIHALTLHGWMHAKQNLGFTDVIILRSGELQFGERKTICEPVFSKMPSIWY